MDGSDPADRSAGAASPRLETLFEAGGGRSVELPKRLRDGYGGGLGFATPIVFANLVSTLDGVTAFGDDTPPSVISAKSPADRFVMGLLRACASAVVVGAGTLRPAVKHRWTPDHVFPSLADDFRRLRISLGLTDIPKLVVLTRTGDIRTSAASLEDGALIITTTMGAEHLRGKVPRATAIRTVMSGRIEPVEVVEILRRDGHDTILTEGGPHILGSFLRSGALDELFLTLSPRVAGRSRAVPRLGLVEGMALDPDQILRATLLSVKRHESHVFLRYGFR
jgi:riboflavin biosynthesis pyrimidine reductase